MYDVSVADSIKFESELDIRVLDDLGDQRVRGAVVLPAAAYLEMALAAG